jgi:hypothetical protein
MAAHTVGNAPVRAMRQRHFNAAKALVKKSSVPKLPDLRASAR